MGSEKIIYKQEEQLITLINRYMLTESFSSFVERVDRDLGEHYIYYKRFHYIKKRIESYFGGKVRVGLVESSKFPQINGNVYYKIFIRIVDGENERISPANTNRNS